MSKTRLDLLLVQQRLVESRAKAQALIMAGNVLVNGQAAEKPGILVPDDAELSIRPSPPYVSRGGVKLEGALDHFGIVVNDLVVLDVGASTGGFTDLLLKRGAAKVYAIDVGYGHLDWRLRQDPRVVVIERTNVRYLESLPELADAAVVDVSFISLTIVLPAILRLLKPEGWIVALVKPQFEAGRGEVGKGGVVKDPVVHRRVLEKITNWSQSHGLAIRGLAESPLRGPAGNREFFVYLGQGGQSVEVGPAIDEVVGGE